MASRIARECRCIFTRLEHVPENLLMKMDTTTLKSIIRKHINETVNFYVDSHAVNGSQLKDTLKNLDTMIDNTKRVLADGVHYTHMMDEIERISQELGIIIEDKAQAKQLAFHLCNANLRGMEQAKRLLNGEVPIDPPEQSPVPEPPAKEPSQSQSPTLSELVDQYRKHQLSTGAWRPGSARNAEPQLKALLSYFKPETSIQAITVNMMQSYVDLLRALPPSYSLMKQYRDKELHELDPKPLMKDHGKHLDQTTVRGYMVMARQLFDYAGGLGLIDKSPVPSLLVPKKKQGHARDERHAYTIDQLHEIFNPERFMPWASYRGLDPAKFWIPVLALCTTGRLEEIAGLRKVDVQNTTDGINIHITDHKKRLIKNDNSERVVPVISSVAATLRDYANSLSDDSMLFPQLTPAHGKLSHNFGKQWSRYVRQKAGIGDPKIAPAHSLRHYTIDLLYKALVPVQVIKALDGHSPGGSETEGRYAKGLEVGTLREHCLPVIEEAVGPVLSGLMVN
jgi:integrase